MYFYKLAMTILVIVAMLTAVAHGIPSTKNTGGPSDDNGIYSIGLAKRDTVLPSKTVSIHVPENQTPANKQVRCKPGEKRTKNGCMKKANIKW